ncbi:MAG: ABC transporter ATP-binding protein [Clostridia bacterium]|nr:ABC transporter ATP-binding protein [Clostridia bacterium]
MKTILKYLYPQRFRMLVGFIIKVGGTVIELFIPYILTHILKNVVGSGNLKLILFWGVMMLTCAGVGCMCNIIANRMAAGVAKNASQNLRHDLFDKTLSLSSSQRDRFTVASLESRITTDTYNIHSFLGMMQRMGVRAPIMLFGGLAITLVMDTYLSLIMAACLPFIFAIIYFIRQKGNPLYVKVQKSVDNMVKVVREDSQGIRVIKALSKNEYERQRFENVNQALSKSEKKAGITMGLVNPLMTLLMNIGTVTVVAVSAYRVSGMKSDPETVIAFIQYFTHISMALMAVTRIFVMYSKCSASAKRVEEVLQCTDELPVYSKAEYPDKKTDSFIEFENVCFSYNANANPDKDIKADTKSLNADNISFCIKKGENLGIIGATGSGKTTLLQLLMRFYDTKCGNIYINGENIRTIEKDRLYSMFGTAMQNDFLYADTVYENIDFGRNLGKEKIENAAKIAQGYDFITSHPEGFERTLSQKGTNISGGQKQRILIARAIAASPEILILDDSSSALDYKTEASLRTALAQNMTSSTVITVAQRVSAVKDCDLILVIDNGKIIGHGKHNKLLRTCVEYKEISDSQMGGAIID